MAGAKFNVSLDDVQAEAALERIAAAGGNAKPLFTEIGTELERSTRERISTTKTGPDGVPWVDISPAWRRRKKARGHAEGILTMRGDLLNSVAFEAAAGFVDIIAGPTEYAAIHQFGGAAGMAPGAAAIPARPYLGVSAEDEAEIRDAALDWLRRLAAA
jgi:phage virion morphogenesis protein